MNNRSCPKGVDIHGSTTAGMNMEKGVPISSAVIRLYRAQRVAKRKALMPFFATDKVG
jgi:hypothetical protein